MIYMLVGVYAYGALELDHLELAVLVLVVQLGLPVVALVEDLVAGGLLGVDGGVLVHGELEGGAADDGVDVAGQAARLDDGVGALDGQGRAVDGEDLGLGGGHGSHGGRGGDDGLLGRHGWRFGLVRREMLTGVKCLFAEVDLLGGGSCQA